MWRLLFSLFAAPLVLLEIAVLRSRGVTIWALINGALYPLLMLMSIAAHEGGHALVALAVGLRVPRIDLGVGRRLRRWRWGRTTFDLNAFPSLGLTYLGADRLDGLRPRLWLAIAAGPVVTTGLLAALLAWPEPMRWTVALCPAAPFAERFAARELLAFGNLWMLVFNLVPLPFFRGLGLMNNDGAQLLTLPFRSPARLREVLASPAVHEAQALSEAGDHAGARRIIDEALRSVPDSWLLRNMRGIQQLDRRQWNEARETFRALLEEEPLMPNQRWVMRNNLAWADFCLRRDDLLPEADEHSAAVVARFKNVPWALGTRGAVLVWLGRPAEAAPLLERAYVRASIPAARAINASCLAMALAALGRLGEAEKWLARAQANHARCEFIAEAREAIARSRAAQALPAAE